MIGVLDRLGGRENLFAAEIHLMNISPVSRALHDDVLLGAATAPATAALDVLLQSSHLPRAILGTCESTLLVG